MGFNFFIIYLVIILAAKSSHESTFARLKEDGYGIPEKPLIPSPARPSEADYTIEEYPAELPVKSKPIESPDRKAVFIPQGNARNFDGRTSYNNVRPPVPATPSAVTAVIDPPLGGYDERGNIVTNGDPVIRRYPLQPPGYETNLDSHHTTAVRCTCVPYFQCDDDGYIITTGAGIIDPRIATPGSPKAKTYSSAEESRPNSCGVYHTCCSERREQSKHNPQLHSLTCGRRNPSGISPRILTPGSAKSESEFGEWPWMAAILKLENGIHIFQCGGTLIDDKHVLTVAHCVSALKNSGYDSESSSGLIVRLGEWDTQQESELISHEDYEVIKVFVHPEFMNQSLWNDIAILRLGTTVELKPNVNPVCLPSPTDQFEGQTCVTTGWGKNAYQGGTYSNIMKEAHLPFIPKRECLKSLRSTRLGPRFQLHSSFICAGGEEGVDSCKGDGGGPLVCERMDGSYAVAGLVAWGIDCGHPGIPGVYVNVQQFLQFIFDNTRMNSVQQDENEGWGRRPLPHEPSLQQRNPNRPGDPADNQRSPTSNQKQRPLLQNLRKFSAPQTLPRYGDASSMIQVRPPQSFPASGY